MTSSHVMKNDIHAYLSIYLPTPSINQAVYPSMHPSIQPSPRPSNPSIHASIHPSLRPSVHPSVRLSIHPLSVAYAPIPPPTHRCTHPCINPSSTALLCNTRFFKPEAQNIIECRAARLPALWFRGQDAGQAPPPQKKKEKRKRRDRLRVLAKTGLGVLWFVGLPHLLVSDLHIEHARTG